MLFNIRNLTAPLLLLVAIMFSHTAAATLNLLALTCLLIPSVVRW